MHRILYSLAFLIPLKGAFACPNLTTLEPFLKHIPERLKDSANALPLVIDGTTYRILQGTDGNTAVDVLNGMHGSYTIERLEELTPWVCTYHVKSKKAFVSGYFVLQRES